MNVDSIALDRFRLLDSGYPGRSHQIEAGDEEVRKKAKPQAEIEEPPVAEETGPTAETQELRGVLRLLQEDHFRGVADLRLRINFAEEVADTELPELSAPQGNGKAYEKFLAIYQSMQETDSTDDVETPDNPDPVETPETPDPVDVVV